MPRFEDLGKPMQKLLLGLKGGYTDDDIALMEYVSVKDMAKVYNDLNAQKKAETIWKELKKELKKRQDKLNNVSETMQLNEDKLIAIEEQQKRDKEAEEEEERRREEKRAKKEARRERKRREAEEEARREEEELAAAEAAEEEKQRRREERRRKQQELEEQAQREAEEEEARLEEERLAAKKARKAEKQRLKAEAEQLRKEQEELKEAAKLKKNKNRNMQAEWEEFVKNHPLEFGGDDGEAEIEQVKVERESRGPPKDFLKIKGVRIPDVDERPEAAFFKIRVHLKNGDIKDVERRYNNFVELRAKLGSALDMVDAPFPGKTFTKVRGLALQKRKEELELWTNTLIQKLAITRSYAGVHIEGKQLHGVAARQEAERQRMAQAAQARQALYEFCELAE